jgi:ABC-2 type transport system ATP-binding protein
MIDVEHLCKEYGSFRALDDVTFHVDKGEVVGFLGPNGAGKTTTMRILTGYMPPSDGRASIAGFDVFTDSLQVRKRIGYMPESVPLYDEMSVHAYLDYMASLRRVPDRDRAIRRAMAACHIEHRAQSLIGKLSKGLRQRVGLAQAILHDPEVLILDEPTDGLDPNQKHEVRGLIRDLAPHKAIVISTHLLEEVDAVCSRALIIDRGRIVADGTPLELAARSSYHNAVTITLSGVPAGEVETSLRAIKGVAKVSVGKIDGGALECTVFPKGAHAIAGEVSRQLQSTGWQVDRFGVETGRLEEVFRNVTTGARAARKGPEAKTR